MDQDQQPATTTPADDVARRLNTLFTTIKRPTGRKHTDDEVADYISRTTGEPCSRWWVGRLRKGEVPNPALNRLEAIARFFDVTPAYFFDDTQAHAINQDLETAQALKDLQAHGLHLHHLTNLNPDDIPIVVELIKRLTNRKHPEPD